MQTKEKPYILDETEDFAVVYKPPCMHSAPSTQSSGDTLFDWYAALFPPLMGLSGKKPGEGGLMHRLDFHTQGLVLFAKNQKTFDLLHKEQEEGHFVKEYKALCHKVSVTRQGFPAFCAPDTIPAVVESYFRPFGPGRKEVRPVLQAQSSFYKIAADRGGYYRTKILGFDEVSSWTDRGLSSVVYSFNLSITRGFRHQIRCHLAWMGYPIINDPLYGQTGAGKTGNLALCSYGLHFPGYDYRIAGQELELSLDSR